MSNRVTFNDAIRSLNEMFPSFDAELLAAMLRDNGNHMERTIEQVLQMETDSGGKGSSEPSSGSSATSPAPVPVPAPTPVRQLKEDTRPYESSDQSSGPKAGSSEVAGMKIGGAYGSPAGVSAAGKRAGGRGTKTTLPDSFLRPPGWRENNLTIGDEQLALMLQDEMFRKELRDAGMGSIFGGGGQRPADGGSSTGSTGSSGSSGSSSNLIPDMGILSGLSSLSLGARRNLNNLAARFSSKKSPPVNGAGPLEGEGEVSMSLLHRDSSARDDDEDDEEVIDFHGKSPSKKL
jgi:hypothetical protein